MSGVAALRNGACASEAMAWEGDPVTNGERILQQNRPHSQRPSSPPGENGDRGQVEMPDET